MGHLVVVVCGGVGDWVVQWGLKARVSLHSSKLNLPAHAELEEPPHFLALLTSLNNSLACI